jgi:hypothetical protein
MVLRRLLGSKREEEREERRILPIKKQHKLSSTPNIITVIIQQHDMDGTCSVQQT